MATSPAQLPRILPQGLPQVGSALSLCGGAVAGFPASCGHCQAGSPPGSREAHSLHGTHGKDGVARLRAGSEAETDGLKQLKVSFKLVASSGCIFVRGSIVVLFLFRGKNQNTVVSLPLQVRVAPILHHTLIKNVDSGARLQGLRF